MTSPAERLARNKDLNAERPDAEEFANPVWRVLDKAHKARNQAEYEGIVDVEENLVRDVIAACKEVAEKIRQLPALK